MNQTQNQQETAPNQISNQNTPAQPAAPANEDAPQEASTPPSGGKSIVGILIVVLILIIALVAAAAAYYFFLYPRQQLEKARTPDTSLKTSESLINRTEIKESGLNSVLVISPSKNDVISGDVTIKATKVPDEAKHVGFSISQTVEGLAAEGPNLGFDSEGSDGWEMPLNTTEYDNGVYYVALFVFETDGSSNPLGTANAKVQIEN